MTRHPGFPVDEIRGRMLHEALLREAEAQIGAWVMGVPVTLPPTTEPPVFPVIAATDTGTLRAVEVAS